MFRLNWLSVFGAICLLVSACSKRDGGNQITAPQPESPAPVVVEVGPPVTDEEAQAFATALERATDARDGNSVQELLKIRQWEKRTISDLGLSEADVTIRHSNPLQSIFKVLDSGGSLKLLRTRSRDNRKSVLFRLLHDDGAVSYFEFTLARFSDAAIGMEDAYNYFTGEMISQTVRRLMIPLERARSSKQVEGFDQVLVDNLPTIRQMFRATTAGLFEQVVTDYGRLPKSLQENKSVFLMYLRATCELGDAGEEPYFKGVEHFRQIYPNDSCVDFISINYLADKKRFDEALKAIDRFEKEIGKDAYLSVCRAKVFLEARRFDDARKLIDIALAQESTLGEAFWTAIDISLVEKKFADTLKWLKKAVQELKIDYDKIEENGVYADFVKSPQYREWQEWYRTRKKK
jgi:tetratricopeptide (TPR) repeat protein